MTFLPAACNIPSLPISNLPFNFPPNTGRSRLCAPQNSFLQPRVSIQYCFPHPETAVKCQSASSKHNFSSFTLQQVKKEINGIYELMDIAHNSFYPVAPKMATRIATAKQPACLNQEFRKWPKHVGTRVLRLFVMNHKSLHTFICKCLLCHR